MLETNVPSKQVININDYKDKVLGCWTGKNIGGTLGAPFEGKREMNDAVFYTQDLQGAPAPNDDLDLQLIWLLAAEEHGIYHITPRLLGEYWINYIVGPWNEYSVCKANIANGLYPPLSGSCNNDAWKYSNGAWIRSEIWACLFPGSPDDAAVFAYMDSCCDHCGEGIYAEVFTATAEAAAFIESDVRKLIEIGLSKIPKDCRIAHCVKLACELYDKGTPFKDARERIVKDNEDLGWFQAPGNIGFTILGLLYGEGDFGKSICLANNCGDDTDCTAATVGALLGIISGRKGIPQNWIAPIGETIKTVAIDPFELNIPKTLGELTSRVVAQALLTQHENPTLIRIANEKTSIDSAYLAKLADSSEVAKRVWSKSPYALTFDLPFGDLVIDYQDGPFATPGVPKSITLYIESQMFVENTVQIAFKLPEGWSAPNGRAVAINCIRRAPARATIQLIPGAFDGVFEHVPLEIRLAGRFNPVLVSVPFQRKGAVCQFPAAGTPIDQSAWDRRNVRYARACVE